LPRQRRDPEQSAAAIVLVVSGLVGPLISTAVYAASPAVLWIGCLVAGPTAGLGQRWLLHKVEARRGTVREPTLEAATTAA
jgi:hypothetical protein